MPSRELFPIKVCPAKLFGIPCGFDALCRPTSSAFGGPLYKSLGRVRPRGASAASATPRVRGASSSLRRPAVPAASAFADSWRRSLAGYVRARGIPWMSTFVSSSCCSRGWSTLCGPFLGLGFGWVARGPRFWQALLSPGVLVRHSPAALDVAPWPASCLMASLGRICSSNNQHRPPLGSIRLAFE